METFLFPLRFAISFVCRREACPTPLLRSRAECGITSRQLRSGGSSSSSPAFFPFRRGERKRGKTIAGKHPPEPQFIFIMSSFPRPKPGNSGILFGITGTLIFATPSGSFPTYKLSICQRTMPLVKRFEEQARKITVRSLALVESVTPENRPPPP